MIKKSGYLKYKASVILIVGILFLSSSTITAKTMIFDDISEGFEGGELPQGWRIIDNDQDGYNWEILSSSEYPVHSGEYAIGSTSYMEPEGNLTPENYLVLPPMIVEENSEISYWFKVVNAGFKENIDVLVSTTGFNPDDFTDIIFGGSLSTSFWWQHSWDISDYEGQMIYLAIRHTHTEGNLRTWLILDDIEVTNVTIVDLPELEIESITGGMGITTTVLNSGTGDANDVVVDVVVDGGLFFLKNSFSQDVSIDADESVEISGSIFGIGLGILSDMPTITVTVTCPAIETIEESADAKVLGPFVII